MDTLRTLMGELLRTVESESRWALIDGFGDEGILRAAGAGLAARRGAFGFEGASVETLAGQANLMVQARLVGSAAGGGVVGFAGATTGFCSSFLPPHANMIHRFLPNVASTPCSPAGVVALGGALVSSSWPTRVIRCSDGFFVNGGSMVWIMVEGSGGLGVHVLVPGLVKPPSLVRSAVEMVLALHVEMHDRPRGGSRSEWSSTGELVFETDCSAVVKSDVLRSMVGFEILVKDPLGECWIFRGLVAG